MVVLPANDERVGNTCIGDSKSMVGEDTVPSELMVVGDKTQYDLADDDPADNDPADDDPADDDPAEVDLAEDKLVADEAVNDSADGKSIERDSAEPPKFVIFPSMMKPPLSDHSVSAR